MNRVLICNMLYLQIIEENPSSDILQLSEIHYHKVYIASLSMQNRCIHVKKDTN